MVVLYQDFDCIITFVSVHQAIAAERSLKRVKIEHVALPTPREISVSCGQCLAIRQGELKEAIRLLLDEKIVWSKIFTRDVRQRIYEEINYKRGVNDADA